jgi:hypothetical protein
LAGSEPVNERVARRRQLLEAVKIDFGDGKNALSDLIGVLVKEGADPYELLEDVQSIRENLGEREDDRALDVMDMFAGYSSAVQLFVSPEEKLVLTE